MLTCHKLAEKQFTTLKKYKSKLRNEPHHASKRPDFGTHSQSLVGSWPSEETMREDASVDRHTLGVWCCDAHKEYSPQSRRGRACARGHRATERKLRIRQ